MGTAYAFAGENKRAKKFIESSLLLDHSLYGAIHPTIAYAEQWLCHIYNAENDLPKAELHCRAAVSIGRSWYSADDQATCSAIRALGVILTEENKLQEARPFLEKALALEKKGEGPEGIAVATGSLAMNEFASGEFAAAERDYNLSLAIFRKVYGTDDNPNVASLLFHLSEVAYKQRSYAGAETLARQALSIFLRVQGPSGPKTAQSHVQLGHCLLLQKRYVEASQESQLGYTLLLKQPGLPSQFLQLAIKDIAQEKPDSTSAHRTDR